MMKKLFSSNERMFPLGILLLIDCIFIVLHFIRKVDDNLFPSLVWFFSNPNFSVSRDGGYPEIFQYIKEFAIAAMLFIIFRQTRKIVYIGWSILFDYLLFDDSIQIHETLGALVASKLPFLHNLGVTPSAYGELLVVGVFGAIFMSLILVGYYYADKENRNIARYLFVLFMGLVFCGVVTDFGDMFVHIRQVRNALVVLEDGGEMIAMSLIFWYVYRCYTMFSQQARKPLIAPDGAVVTT